MLPFGDISKSFGDISKSFGDISKSFGDNFNSHIFEDILNHLELSLNTGALTISSNRFKDISKYTRDL